MITYPDIDPIAFTIGPLSIRWYGLMYILGFIAAWLLARSRANKAGSGWTTTQVDDLITYCVFGVILGGRLGYTLFYETSYFLHNPLDIFKIWNGGMSFHGGLIGVIAATWLFARHHGKTLFEVSDFTAPLVAPGLFAGRLGNFMNAELWGRHTTVEWGMVFPGGGPLPRHPSQLYEALLEGLALFIILWIFSSKPRPRMAVSGMFLMLYGSFRFFVEFFREPDAHLGYLAFGWVTMGQILCLPMILGGLSLLIIAMRNEEKTATSTY